MPSGVVFPIGASCPPLHISRDVSTHATPFQPPIPHNTGCARSLVDLLDLHDSGEPVIWPPGFDSLRAKHFVHDYKHALCICQLSSAFDFRQPAGT